MGLGEGSEGSLTCDPGVVRSMPCWPLGHVILREFGSPATFSLSRSRLLYFPIFKQQDLGQGAFLLLGPS